MLRRVKRKAPLPPCDINGSVRTSVSSDNCEDQQQDRAASSEPSDSLASCKRTRKFGVIARSSFNRDTRDSTDSQLQGCYNGFSSSAPTDAAVSPAGEDSGCILSAHSPTEESAETFPQVRRVPHRLHRGSTATLPVRCHSQLLECKMNSFSSEPSSQVRHSAVKLVHGCNEMHICGYRMVHILPHRVLFWIETNVTKFVASRSLIYATIRAELPYKLLPDPTRAIWSQGLDHCATDIQTEWM